MVLVFDLDDTLYPEITFVKSGFKAVADYLHEEYGLYKNSVYNSLLQSLEQNGRGEIFNDELKKQGIFSNHLVKKCIQIYRFHKPEIKLYPEANRCLKRFSRFPLYIVTDGNKLVQANKIKALELERLVKHAYITYRHGLKNSKPSPYCFELIAKKERVAFDKIAYVADNPIKDFVGIKPLGFKTIRILQGNYSKLKMDAEHEAHINIGSLNELNEHLLQRLGNDHNNNQI
jgi:putative hydrolase of the HAD superfamily